MVSEHLDVFALRLLIADDVGMQEIRMREVDEILQRQRCRAIEAHRAAHVAGQAALRRQEGQIRQVDLIGGAGIAEPAPHVAIALHHRITARAAGQFARGARHLFPGMEFGSYDGAFVAPQIVWMRVHRAPSRALADGIGVRKRKPRVL